MRINIDNFSGTKGYDIDLRQKEVGGGRITIEQIDSMLEMQCGQRCKSNHLSLLLKV